MKKVILGIGLSFIFFLTFSQDAEDKVPTGKISIDLNFNPAAIFDANAGTMFNMPVIKGRYFMRSDLALRLSVNAEFGSDKNYSDADGNDYTKTKSTLLSIAPGIEKLYGSNRFYIYLGGEIPIVSYSTKEIVEQGGNTTEFDNPNGGYFGIGLHGIIGVDFYIFPKIYIGAEFTPGYIFTSTSDVKVDNDVIRKGGYSSSFGLSSSSGLRLGVRF